MHEKNIIIKTREGNLDCKIFINSNIDAPAVIFYMDAPGIREELRTMCRRILKNVMLKTLDFIKNLCYTFSIKCITQGFAMSTAVISSKGWIVIPAELRRKYNLKAGDQVEVVDYGGLLGVLPTSNDPIKDSMGSLKSNKKLSSILLKERAKERKRER